MSYDQDEGRRLPVTEFQWRERHRSVDNKLAAIDDRLLNSDAKLTDIAVSMGKLEKHLEVLAPFVADQENRVRKLEQHRNWIAGVLATAGVSGTSVAMSWDKFKGALLNAIS
jgi:hypothetical protein